MLAGCDAKEGVLGEAGKIPKEMTVSTIGQNVVINETGESNGETSAIETEASTAVDVGESTNEEYENPLFHQGLLAVRMCTFEREVVIAFISLNKEPCKCR